MIGPIEIGTLSSAQLSAVIHQGLTVTLPDGRAGRLAIIDAAGQVIDDTPAVAREAFNVAIASYKNFLVGKGHLRVRTGPLPGLGPTDAKISACA